jgi:TM2 domain-containing membrane protein YozV
MVRFCRGCGRVFEETQYYIWQRGNTQPLGPVPENDLKQKLAQRHLTPEDSIAKVGEQRWTPISQTPLWQANNAMTAFPAPVSQPIQQYNNYYAPAPVMQSGQQSNNMSDVGKVMMYESNKKSVGVAYLLWFFFGMFGVHRFYLGETGTGAAILIITICSILLKFVLIGFLTIFISIIWVLVDLFLIPALAQKYNHRLAARLNIQA